MGYNNDVRTVIELYTSPNKNFYTSPKQISGYAPGTGWSKKKRPIFVIIALGNINLLQIHCWLYQWTNSKNRLLFDEAKWWNFMDYVYMAN